MYKQTEINNEALNADAKLAAEKGPKNPFLKAFKQYYWQMGLVFTLLLFFVIIEIRHPYMFLQDDNRDLGLPNFVHAYRSLMNGEIALFNFHQYLGTPFMGSITLSLVIIAIVNLIFKIITDGRDVQINRDVFGRMLIKVPEG